MYRIYLRSPNGIVTPDTKTTTDDQEVAVAAFEELVNRADLDGTGFAAALTFNHIQIAYHRFERQHGQPDNWRGRIGDLPLHIVEGRKGKTAARSQFVTVRMEVPVLMRATEIGRGDLSAGLKLAVRKYLETSVEAA